MGLISANQLNAITKEDIVDMFCDDIMQRILKANSYGNRETCFDNASVVRVINGEGDYTYYPAYKFYKIDNRHKMNYVYVPLDDYRNEVKAKLRSAGYTVKPTGYIGGVWQTTESVVW